MNSQLGHLQFNIDYKKNINFYKNLLEFLGWQIIGEWGEMIGFKNNTPVSLWFSQKTDNSSNTRDAHGLNHIGIQVDSIEDVDKTVEYLKKENIELLFETPRHRPEFAGEGIYYQVMFDSPDGVLLEVVYTGDKK